MHTDHGMIHYRSSMHSLDRRSIDNGENGALDEWMKELSLYKGILDIIRAEGGNFWQWRTLGAEGGNFWQWRSVGAEDILKDPMAFWQCKFVGCP